MTNKRLFGGLTINFIITVSYFTLIYLNPGRDMFTELNKNYLDNLLQESILKSLALGCLVAALQISLNLVKSNNNLTEEVK